jgi:hypothetical protein
MARLGAVVLLLGLVAAACGGRPGPECELPPASATPTTVERLCEGRCVLETHDALERPVRLECDGTACHLLVAGELQCTCDDLDWANTCATGVPTCLATSGLFSFVDYTIAPCE